MEAVLIVLRVPYPPKMEAQPANIVSPVPLGIPARCVTHVPQEHTPDPGFGKIVFSVLIALQEHTLKRVQLNV